MTLIRQQGEPMDLATATTPLTGPALWDGILRARDAMQGKLARIAGFVAEEPADFIRMTAREACSRIGTSEPTLIRFCRALGFSGLADFRIELALALAGATLASDRRRLNPDGKRRIARAAVALLDADQALLIDNGSTAEILAEEIARDDRLPPMTLMTNGMAVAQKLMRFGRHRVMLTGGVISTETAALSGRMAEAGLAEMCFDSFLMGADSIDPETGISTCSEDDAHVTRAMVDAAARVIVLADHSKFRRARLHRICDLSRIAVLVTDRDPDPAMARAITAAGVRLIVAGGSPE